MSLKWRQGTLSHSSSTFNKYSGSFPHLWWCKCQLEDVLILHCFTVPSLALAVDVDANDGITKLNWVDALGTLSSVTRPRSCLILNPWIWIKEEPWQIYIAPPHHFISPIICCLLLFLSTTYSILQSHGKKLLLLMDFTPKIRYVMLFLWLSGFVIISAFSSQLFYCWSHPELKIISTFFFPD